MTFVPWLWICWSMEARAPEPSAIIAITEATPMMTPSMVRAGAHLVAADGLERDAQRVAGSSC